MIHGNDNAEVQTKITDEGDIFIFCPECHGVWQMSTNVIHEPKAARPITYAGTGINLDLGSSAKPSRVKPSDGKAAIARELFPEAFR